MKLRRIQKQSFTSTKPLETKHVTYIWCNDGWCYVPELKQRKIYYTCKEKDQLSVEVSSWEGVIPLAEYVESIKMTVYSNSPMLWKEETEDFCEIYEEISSNQHTSS